MKRLVSIEFQKIWGSRSSRILMISYFGLLTFLAIFSFMELNFLGFNLKLSEQGFYEFPFVWHFNSYVADFFKLFLAVVIVSMIAHEYSHKTLKQNLIDGLSKGEFLLSKFLMAVVFALVSTLLVFVVSLLLGLKYSSNTQMGVIFSQLSFLFAYFLKLVGFFSICLFFAVLTRKSAFSLGFLVLWYIVEYISTTLLFYNNGRKPSFLSRLFPLEAMSNLIREPFSRLKSVQMIASEVGFELDTNFLPQLSDILIVISWITIFMYLSYFLLKKRDL